MIAEQGERETFDNVQYKFYVFPDFQPDKSAVCMKTHHCFTDGLGYGTFFLSLSGEYDADQLPSLKPLSCLKKIGVNLLYPYLLLTQGFKILFTSRNHNSIKKRIPMSGNKNAAFTCDLDIKQMKVFCK